MSRVRRPLGWLLQLSLLLSAVGCRSAGGPEQVERQLRCQLKALGAADAERREVAVEGLGRLGAKAAPAVPKLSALLVDPSATLEVQQALLASLGQIGPASVAAVPSIVRAASNRPELEPLARLTLTMLGPEAGARTVALLGGDPAWKLRRQAAVLAAGLTGKGIDEGLLTALLRDRRGEVRQAAAVGLGKRRVGRGAWALGRALSDEHWATAVAAATALARLDTTGRRLLQTALRDPRPATSLAAAAVLEPLPPGAATALPTWLKAIGDPRWPVRAAVARAVGKLGPAAASARVELNRLLTDSAIEVQEAAEDALARLGAN